MVLEPVGIRPMDGCSAIGRRSRFVTIASCNLSIQLEPVFTNKNGNIPCNRQQKPAPSIFALKLKAIPIC